MCRWVEKVIGSEGGRNSTGSLLTHLQYRSKAS